MNRKNTFEPQRHKGHQAKQNLGDLGVMVVELIKKAKKQSST